MVGRPRKYFTEEERIKAFYKSKNKYMVNKEWLCPDCGNRDYTLAGKWTHLKSKKHIKNHFLKNGHVITLKENDINLEKIFKKEMVQKETVQI